jgi:pilus assembly protein CpaE
VDLVLPLGSIAPIVGYEGPLNIVEASEMTGAETTVEYLQNHLPETGLWGFQLLAGSPIPQMSNELDASRIPILLNTIQQGFDYVFVDLGRSLSRISLPILTNADQIVLILSPDQSTVALTKTVVDYLMTKGLKDSQVYLLFNRTVGLEGMPKSEIESLLNLPISGAIPYMNTNFSLANNLHVPITYKFPDDVVAITIRQVANEIRVRTHEVGELRQKAVS